MGVKLRVSRAQRSMNPRPSAARAGGEMMPPAFAGAGLQTCPGRAKRDPGPGTITNSVSVAVPDQRCTTRARSHARAYDLEPVARARAAPHPGHAAYLTADGM